MRRINGVVRHVLFGGRLRLIGVEVFGGVLFAFAFRAGLPLIPGALVLILVVVRLGDAFVAEIERGQHILHRLAEPGLVFRQTGQLIETIADFLFQNRAPQIDQLAGGSRWRLSGEPFTHHHGKRFRQRRVGTLGDLVVLAAMEIILEHCAKIFRNPRHPARADGFDPRLLDGVEHATRLLIAGHKLLVNFGIMTSEAQRHRVGVPAHDRRIFACQLARRLRQPRLSRRKAGDARPRMSPQARTAWRSLSCTRSPHA